MVPRATRRARQQWFREQLDAPTADGQLRLVARNARRRYERAGKPLDTVRAATASDEDFLALWQAIHDDRLRRARITAKHLAGKAKLRTTRAQTARTLWTLTIPELYVVQTHTAGLTPDQYERWLADLLVTALLEP